MYNLMIIIIYIGYNFIIIIVSYAADTYGTPRNHARNDIVKTNNIQAEETQDFTMSDEPVLDPYPSKIP